MEPAEPPPDPFTTAAGDLSTTVGELSAGGGAAAAEEHRPLPDDTSSFDAFSVVSAVQRKRPL